LADDGHVGDALGVWVVVTAAGKLIENGLVLRGDASVVTIKDGQLLGMVGSPSAESPVVELHPASAASRRIRHRRIVRTSLFLGVATLEERRAWRVRYGREQVRLLRWWTGERWGTGPLHRAASRGVVGMRASS
jgi:hypothetical protein